MKYFETQYNLEYIKKRVEEIKNKQNSKDYEDEGDLCYYEDTDLMANIYLGVYNDKLTITFSKILYLDEGGYPLVWDNIDAVMLLPEELELNSKEDLERQMILYLEEWVENQNIKERKE